MRVRKFLKAAGLLVLGFCALNFFLLGGLLLYVLEHFDVNRAKLSNARLALEGQRYMSKDEEKFLSRFEHEEIIEVWQKYKRAQVAAERRSASLERRQAFLAESQRLLQMLNDQNERRKSETKTLLAKTKAERERTELLKLKSVLEITSPSFKKQYEAIMKMEPEAAAELLDTMEPDEAARYLAQMQGRKAAAILNALMTRPDGANTCAEIIRKIRVIEDIRGSG